MELTPVKFLVMFLLLAAIGYIVFTCTARLVAWLVSRMIGGVVRFRVAGLNGLKEICVDLHKGLVASVAISDLKVSVRKPSGATSWNVFSWFSKFQLIVSEVEVTLRDFKPEKRTKLAKKRNRHSPTGRGKWMLVTNLARYLNVSINEITVKLPESTKLTLEIKELDFDSFRDETVFSSLGVKIFLAPCVLYFAEDKQLSKGSGIFGIREKLVPARTEFVVFSLEQFTLAGTFNHERETGVIIKQLEAGCGEVIINLKPELFRAGAEEVEVEDGTKETEPRGDPEMRTDAATRTLIGNVPERINFSLPKFELNIYFFDTEFPTIRNYVKGVFLRGNRSQPLEGSAGVTDIEMDVEEIHVCQEEEHSVIDITKVSVEISGQLIRPFRTEVDVKFGDTQLNLYMSRYGDLMELASLFPIRKRSKGNASRPSKKSSISWSCSISAPETSIFVYSPDGMVLAHLSSQTFHLYANIMPEHGAVVHGELGELSLDMVEGGQLRSAVLVGVEGCPDSLMHVARISIDTGLDAERTAEKPALMLEAGSTEISLGLRKLEAAIVTLVSIHSCVKGFPWKRKSRGSKERDHSEGSSLIKLNLQRVHLLLDQEMHVEDLKVPDPKKVNFGSQGGVVVITKHGENLRTAGIRPANFGTKSSSEDQTISCTKQQLGVTFLQIAITIDRKKKTTLWEMETARISYKELGVREKVLAEETVLSLENLKLIHRPAEVATEVLMHLLISANAVTAYWDPDVHLFFYELNLRLKELRQKHRGSNGIKSSKSKVASSKTVFALDIERTSCTAELADGVKGTALIQSIFSEDAAVGMLFESLELALNKAAVFRSERLQVSRVPALVPEQAIMQQLWDVIIQGAGVQIIMPYRLPLRAIEDSVEDMWRGLKLAMTAKRGYICRRSVSEDVKPKAKPSFRVYSIKLHVRGITGEIEEEPFQGWLDEHYRLLRQQCRMLLVRERLLEESTKLAQPEMLAKKRELWEQLQEQTFQEYKQACMKLSPSKGSGACETGFQAGFRPSVKRSSLMSITAEKLELTLTDIKGGQRGMVELIRKLDCVKPEMEVPFARLIGRHAVIAMDALAVCLRDYTLPMLSASTLNCEGNVVFAQQATCFQNQIVQHLYVGRWRKLEMWRSASGTTPSYKFYSELPIHLSSGKVGFGVGFEPALADVSYAFTVALRKYNLSVRDPGLWKPPVKKEKSLPWWDDMRYYVHGVNSVNVADFEWSFVATADPYELQNRMHMVASTMLITQSEGRLSFLGTNFDMFISSLESSTASSSRNHRQFIHAPVFQLDISMDWSCASGDPLNHYLHAFPSEPHCRQIVYDPFRSLSLSLIWSFSLRTSTSAASVSLTRSKNRKDQKLIQLQPTASFGRFEIPFMSLCCQDLIWIFKWWNLYFSPPYKLRAFSRYPRFGVERIARSGNLSFDKVTTEFILRLDATPASIRHFPLIRDDPAEGLAFSMQKLRYELCYSRGLQKYTFDGKRDLLDLVYQGLDVHLLKAKLKKTADIGNNTDSANQKHKDDDFLLSTDCFTMRKQSPKADTTRLSSWRENAHSRASDYYKLSESENSDPVSSDPSDDDAFNVVLADNCLRVSLYGLKLFWTVSNRDAVWAWVGEISKAFEAPKPSPSRQYAQRKIMEEKQKISVLDDQGVVKPACSASVQGNATSRLNEDVEEEGTLQFMVNVIHPQFNLHSEDAHGRFLLAAASGRVLARSFHSIFVVGFEVIEQTLGAGIMPIHGNLPQVSWKRRELSVLLEHVQAHVAPTDVDPGAGIQWLPRIPKAALQVKRTGALLERVFLPCSMYFQYSRHKGGTTDCKVKPLKELSFNSPNITATMTSRQFHIMVDVLSNLLFATLPKPRKGEEEEDIQEATDEVVPDGVEEVELARIKLEQAERDLKLAFDDLRVVKQRFRGADGVASPDQLSSGESPEGSLNRVLSKTSALVRRLEFDLALKRKARKTACASVRLALQRAAHQRLTEKEKSKSPSAAMRISWAINKVVWSMLSDGETFAEAEISNMTLNVDRDFSDMGSARFNVKSFVVKNGLPHAKSDAVLSAWNAPSEWGRNVMLRVDARQGAPKDGISLLELFQVEIYPLKIHLTESMYTMMWDYFFPGDEQDPQIRQEAWRGSTASGSRRSRKGAPNDQSVSRASAPGTPPTLHGTPQRDLTSASQALPIAKHPEHRRSVSLGRGWDENETTDLLLYAESVSMVKSSAAPGADKLLAALSPVNSTEADSAKSKDVRKTRSGKEDKKETKYRKIFLEIHNIKISQVELLVTYEGSKFSVSELRLLMDTFTRNEFTGSWRRLFSRVKKHIIWGVLKSVTGMQGKKFKDKKGAVAFQDSDSNSSDSFSGMTRVRARFPIPHFQKHGDRAGEGFVSSIRGLFNSQKRKLVRNIRGEEAQQDWSEGDSRVHRSKSKLLRRHSKRQRASLSKGAILLGDRYPSPRGSPPYHSDAETSSGSSTYEDFDM